MSPILTLLLQTVVIVAAARATGLLFQRLGQPAVIGEMTAGLLLGPSLLGRVAPAFAGFLFPASSLDLLNTFSQFGLVLFMFLVGTRLDTHHLQAHSRMVAMLSYVSMLLPFALGVAMGWFLAPRFGISQERVVPFVLFVGLSLSITAFPVLVRIVDEHGLSTTRLGTIAVTCAAFDDVTAWVVLAFVTSIAHGAEVSIGSSLLWVFGYAVVMWYGVRPLLRWYIQRHRGDAMTVVVIVALASAATTEWLGLHPLFGSFFLGALISRDVQAVPQLRSIEPLTTLMFVPIFFAFTGLRTNVYLIETPGLMLQAVLVLLLAMVGKGIGPWLVSRWLRLAGRETMALGALMNTRGLVELVVLNIGLEVGLLPPPLFAMLTLMALATTAMTSPLLHALGYPRR